MAVMNEAGILDKNNESIFSAFVVVIVRPLACHSSLAQVVFSFRLAWLRWNGHKLTVL
jgi:hypothetical protein